MSDDNGNPQTNNLSGVKKPVTDDLSKSEYGKTWAVSEDASISQALSEILAAALEDQPTPEKRGILFYVANQSKPIVVTGTDLIRLGRADSQNKPTVDLNKFHARELGVSRNHAEITYNGGIYYIKDNGSTNGTFVNGERLAPYRQSELKDSDQIRLGHFTMLVKFGT